MIRPIIIAEYHQTRHNLLKGIAFFGGFALVLRLMGGAWGAGIILLVLLPNLGLAFGLGTFTEEFTKGQFKFLFSLPVRRFTIWWVKCLSGALGLIMFAFVIGAAIFAFPGEDFRQLFEVFPALNLSPLSLIWFLASICAYGFGVGVFSITACSSPKVAGLGSAILLYLPPLAIGASFYFLGEIVPFAGVILILSLASACFCLGALMLFLVRNPFVDAAWMRRCTALAIVGATCAAMIVATVVAMTWPAARIRPDFGNVLLAQASPDGEHIFVMTQERLIETHSYVIAPDGTIEHDLGSATSTMGEPELTWRKGRDGLNVAYVNTAPIWNQLLVESRDKSESEVSILNLDTGQVTKIPNLAADIDQGYVHYDLWTPDGRLLLGRRIVKNGKRSETRLIAQEVETGDVSEFGSATADSAVYFLPSGHAVICKWEPETQGATEFVIINPQTGHRQEITLPSDIVSPEFLPDLSAVFCVNKYFEDQEVGYEILRYSIATGNGSVVIGRTDLPQGTLEQAARYRLGSVSCELSPHGYWMIYHTFDYDQDRESTDSLVNLRTQSRFVLPSVANGATYSEWLFSPQESRLLGFALVDENADRPEELECNTQQLQMRILDVNSDELTTIYSGRTLGFGISPQWLNEDTLVYLQANSDAGDFQTGMELWRLDIMDGATQQIVPRQSGPTELKTR